MTFEEFSEIPLFSTFPESILRHLFDLMKEKEYPPGSVITQEGDKGDSFFIVVSGEMEVRKVTDRSTGKYKAITRIGEKEIFGEMSVFDQTPRSADVVALTDVTLLQVTVPYLKGLLHSDPVAGADFLMAMIALLVGRIRQTNQSVAVLSETGRLVASSQDIPSLTRGLFDLIVRSFDGTESAILALYNWFNDEFNVVESTSDPERTIPMIFEPSNELIFRLTRSEEPILIKGGGRASEPTTFKLEGVFAQARSILAAPFYYGKNIFGFVVLMNWNRPSAFTRQQLVLLQGLCYQVAPAMETLRYRSEEEARARLAKAKGEM